MFFAAGLESVLTNSTLLAYLKTLVQTKNTHIWYGVISCSYYVMDIFSSFILAPYVDRTRNIRVIILLCICFIIAGNLVYVIHFSPYFLLLGRTISGIGAGWRPCAVGETNRSYNRNERSKRTALLMFFYIFATTVAPGFNIIFTNTNFHIMSLKVTYANIPGIYASILLFVIQIFAFFRLSNFSILLKYEDDDQGFLEMKKTQYLTNNDEKSKHEQELLQQQQQQQQQQKQDSSNGNRVDTKSFWNFIATAFRCPDIILIFTATFVFNFIEYIVDMWIPLLILEGLEWTQTYVYLAFLGIGLVFMISMMPLTTRKLSQTLMFKVFLCLAPMFIVTTASILTIFSHPKDKILDISLTALVVVSYGLSIAAEILLMSMVSLFLPNSSLAKGESVRMFFERVGTLIGTLFGGVTYPMVPILVPIMMVCTITLYFSFMIRYRSFSNPAPVF